MAGHPHLVACLAGATAPEEHRRALGSAEPGPDARQFA